MAGTVLTEAELIELESLLQAETYRKCETSLKTFTETAWPIVEPSKRFIDNWHLDVICNHLEAVARGQINRLIINVPYRAMKSLICSVMFPAWVWMQDPSIRFLSGSHSKELSIRDAIKTRGILDSIWYRAAWGEKVQFAADQNQKTRYKTTAMGERLIFGMRTGISGEGADILMIDDPHSAKRAMFSKQERETAIQVFDQEAYSRLNDQHKSAIVIIMQRFHEQDLTGHLLGPEWVHLCIPFKWEPDREPSNNPLGWKDPRSTEGALYWEERFDEAYYAEALARLGTVGVACQLQQRPAPASGGMCNLKWFIRYDHPPARGDFEEVLQFWDTASKGDELIHCPWVCLTVGKLKGPADRYYILDVHREFMNYPLGKRRMKELGQKWQPNYLVIEDKSTGESLLQEVPEESPLTCLPFQPEGDKEARFGIESPAIEAGKVWIPATAPWLQEFLMELQNFPNSAYKDQGDVISMMLKWFRERRGEPRVRFL